MIANQGPSISRLLARAVSALREGDVTGVARALAEVEARREGNAEPYGRAESQLIALLRLRATQLRALDTPPVLSVNAEVPSPDVSSAVPVHTTAPITQSQAVNPGKRVGSGTDTPMPGVTIVTCCMNRTENLLKALATWLSLSAIDEVIIVDWCSSEPVANSLARAGFNDARVRIVRVEDEPRWILSFAFNLGFRLARFDRILKLDADITLMPDYFERNTLPEGSFIAGDWQEAEKGQEHINGFFYIRQQDLLQVKGFNEFITTYGWDDDDLYERLIRSGLKRTCVDTRSIYHIPHDDAQRLGAVPAQPTNALEQLNNDTLFKIRTNRFLATMMPAWNRDRIFAPFEVCADTGSLTTVRRMVAELPHIVSDEIRHDAESYAATELVSWRFGPQIYHVPRQRLMALLALKRLEQIGKVDIALAGSSAVPASVLGQKLVAVELATADGDAIAAVMKFLIGTLDAEEIAIIIVGGDPDSRERATAASAGRARSLNLPLDLNSLRLVEPVALSNLASLVDETAAVHLTLNAPMAEAARIAIGSPSIRLQRPRLYVDAQHGLGNRLRAYGSGAAIARATGRELILVWVPDHHCECRFGDLFDAPSVTVVESVDEIPVANLRRYTYMELEPGACKDQPIDLDTPQDVLIRSAYVLNHPASSWDSENDELRSLKPTRKVAELVESVNLKDCIGAHVRMEAGKDLDKNSYDASVNWSQESHDQIHFWRSKSHYSAFLRRIDELFAEHPARRLFLATDLPDNYELFRHHYGERMCYLPRQLFDRSREQIVYALADAILLSRCEMLLGSTWSSFSELAMRLSTNFSKIEMSGKDF